MIPGPCILWPLWCGKIREEKWITEAFLSLLREQINLNKPWENAQACQENQNGLSGSYIMQGLTLEMVFERKTEFWVEYWVLRLITRMPRVIFHMYRLLRMVVLWPVYNPQSTESHLSIDFYHRSVLLGCQCFPFIIINHFPENS